MTADSAAAELLAARARSSRELGARPELVLDGGGNTSVKTAAGPGGADAILWVKPSGCDLDGISAADFVPLDLAALRARRDGPSLDEFGLAAALDAARVRATDRPASIEALLHAWLPARFVDHSHALPVLALGNCVDGEALLEEVYGPRAAAVPYAESGFPLALAAAAAYDQRPGDSRLEALLLRHHGLFTWGADADACLARHLALVADAEAYLEGRGAPRPQPRRASAAGAAPVIAELCAALEAATGLCWREAAVDPAYFRLADAAQRAAAGPVTPGDLLRLGPQPLWLTSSTVAGVEEALAAWRADAATAAAAPLSALVVDGGAAFAAGPDATRAAAAAKILELDLATRLRGSVLGPWKSLDPAARRAAASSLAEQVKLARRKASSADEKRP